MDDWPDDVLEPSTFEDHVMTLVRMSTRVLKSIGSKHPLYRALNDAIADVEHWYDNDDPIANGWVGKDGLP